MIVRLTSDPDRRLAYWECAVFQVEDGGGWVTSVAHTWPMRFECQPGSALPESLRAAGYSVANAGTTERLLPFTQIINGQKVQQLAPSPIDIFELRLP
jgi:hypothetical protein